MFFFFCSTEAERKTLAQWCITTLDASMLLLPGSRKNCLKKLKIKNRKGQISMPFLANNSLVWHLNFLGWMRPSIHKVKDTPTTPTWQWKQQSHVSTYLTDLLWCASAAFSNRAKTTSWERRNLDANHGKFIRITVVSINFSEWILKMPIKNNIYGNTPWDRVCRCVKAWSPNVSWQHRNYHHPQS